MYKMIRAVRWYVCGPCKNSKHGGCNNRACVCCKGGG